jgi:hypothetical protein
VKLSFDQIRELLMNAVRAAEGKGYNCYVVELFDDAVVYQSAGADRVEKYFRRTYAIVDGKVTLGEAAEVQRTVDFLPVKAACEFLTAVAAVEGEPACLKWSVRVIEFGPDKQGAIFWDKTALTAALPMFDGAKVFALNNSQHQERQSKFGKSTRELVGALTKAVADDTGISAEIVIMPSATWLHGDLVACQQNNIPYVYGLSVDINAKAAKVNIGGKKMMVPQQVKSVQVDVVYEPAAGGGFIHQLAAAVGGETEELMLKKLLAALQAKRPDLYLKVQAKINDGSITEDEALDQITAAMASPLVDMGSEMRAAIAAVVTEEMSRAGKSSQGEGESMKAVNMLACKLVLRDELTGSKLPEPVASKLQRRFEGTVFPVETLRAAIKEEKEMLDQLTASGTVLGAGGFRVVIDQRDKVDAYLDDFFAGKVNSFKAAYQDITGDLSFTGQMRNATRLTASIQSGTFAEALGDAITRQMLKEYNLAGLSDWRKIVEVAPLNDFRTQHRPRMGGYGDLLGVAEGGPYAAVASPSDEEMTYAPSKRGGTEDVTLEAIRNDDVQLIRRIPVKLSRAAARTLYKFVFAFLDTNAAIYDAKALFHVDHANLKAAALDKAALQAARLQMIQQTDFGGNDYLGIPPRFLILPSTLEDTGYELTVQPNLGQFTPTQADTIRRHTWELIVNPFWTDVNNWFLAADPKDLPTIEIGFLDGKEEPELFVQDMPNVGSMFSNDKLTYKIRHIYGGAVGDFRGFQGNIVAG